MLDTEMRGIRSYDKKIVRRFLMKYGDWITSIHI